MDEQSSKDEDGDDNVTIAVGRTRKTKQNKKDRMRIVGIQECEMSNAKNL